MSQEPSYPADAVPGAGSETISAAKAKLDASPAIGATEVTPPTAEDAAKTRRWQAGVAIGVGSAAIAAALLYANRSRR